MHISYPIAMRTFHKLYFGYKGLLLNNLFKLFSPGEKHINENEGIELALAKLIMEAHSGEIEASNLGTGGALVRLTFPRNIN